VARRRKTKIAVQPDATRPAAGLPPPRPGRALGWALLAVALAFSAVALAPEARVERVPANDLVFHRAASERLGQGLAAGEPFLEPWVSEWSLGYPVWRSYQPLPHLAAAAVLRALWPVAAPDAAFAVLFFLVVATMPGSVFLGARLLGLTPAAAGLAAVLLFAPSAPAWAHFGIGYDALAWRGSGLYTQAVAIHFLALALGLTARALDGRLRPAWAGALVAMTTVSHIVFGYVAFVSAAVLAVVGPRAALPARARRLAAVAAPALALGAWFVVPLALRLGIVNHSRWEDAQKWDSYGARFILGALFSGSLLDSGRGPWLTALVALGLAGALLARREIVARRLLALTAAWLALFWGRPTWGGLLVAAGVPADLPLHRLHAAFELSALLLTAFGLARLAEWLLARWRPAGLVAIVAAAGLIVAIGVDRARYLAQSAAWGDETRAAYAAERSDLDAALADVRAILAERPGRVSAGRAAGWGATFRIGSVPVYAFLTRAHLDQVSFLFHAMSKTSDIMVLRNEDSPAQDAAFGVRAVVAPAGQAMPAHLRPRGVHGRFAVYEAAPEGYFGLADFDGHYVGPAANHHEVSVAWMASPLPRRGYVIALDPRVKDGPELTLGSQLPAPPGPDSVPGRFLSERKEGETYAARVHLDRPAHVLVRITWTPDLAATLDGAPVPFLHVTPGFGAIAVPAGDHDVAVRYRPGPLKPILLVAGVAVFAWTARPRKTAG
jgi:hypothetical protein